MYGLGWLLSSPDDTSIPNITNFKCFLDVPGYLWHHPKALPLTPWPGRGQDPGTAVLCGQSGAEPWRSNLEKDGWLEIGCFFQTKPFTDVLKIYVTI